MNLLCVISLLLCYPGINFAFMGCVTLKLNNSMVHYQVAGGRSFFGTRCISCQPQRCTANNVVMQAEFNPKKLVKDAEERMQKSIEKCKENLSTLRTGRANPSILDRVFVDYFGTPTPLKSLATVKTSSASQLTVEAYDRTTLTAIEKGILESGIGLNPNNDGNFIRLNIPPITEDRRKELCKEARSLGEESKVAIRNIRRDIVDIIKKAEKGKEISQDQAKNSTGEIQKLTDKYSKLVDEAVSTKEKDVMTI